MNKKNDAQTNTLKISENVIARIVEIAVKNVDGVCGLKKAGVRFDHLFSADIPSAVDIRTANGAVSISVSVIVSYNCKVKLVAEHIQQKIKDDVQNMAGIAVSKVNVVVDGIEFDSQEISPADTGE